MSFFKNKPLVITAAVIVVAVILAMVSHFSDGMPGRVAGFVVTPVEKVLAKVVSPVARWKNNLFSAGKLREENEKLKEEIIALQSENRSVKEYVEENARLKELLGLKEEMAEKEVLAATVISADSDDFSKTITINRGSGDGIELEDAVISNLGVIGRVSELGGDWARVTTILAPEHSIGVRVTRTGDLAVLQGDISLAKDKLCRLDYISGSAELIVGDILETSGVGGIYPPGVSVGRISQVRMDNSGAVDYAVVEPTVDFSQLFEVLVITDWKRESISPEYIDGADDEIQDEMPVEGELSQSDIENAIG